MMIPEFRIINNSMKIPEEISPDKDLRDFTRQRFSGSCSTPIHSAVKCQASSVVEEQVIFTSTYTGFFLAVQNSSIGDLVTDSLSHSLTD